MTVLYSSFSYLQIWQIQVCDRLFLPFLGIACSQIAVGRWCCHLLTEHRLTAWQSLSGRRWTVSHLHRIMTSAFSAIIHNLYFFKYYHSKNVVYNRKKYYLCTWKGGKCALLQYFFHTLFAHVQPSFTATFSFSEEKNSEGLTGFDSGWYGM